MNIGDLAKIADALSKMKPDEIAEQVRNQMAPATQLLASIDKGLENLNENIIQLTEALNKRNE